MIKHAAEVTYGWGESLQVLRESSYQFKMTECVTTCWYN